MPINKSQPFNKPSKPRKPSKRVNKPIGAGDQPKGKKKPDGVGDRTHPRKPGQKPDYTREQTDRYKARAGRLARASKLLQNFDSRVYQVASGNINYYYIDSSDGRVAEQGSLPKVGARYHCVTCDRDKPPPPPPPNPPAPPGQPPPGVPGTPGVNPNTVYVSDLATGLGGLPAGWVSAARSQVGYNGLIFPDIGSPVVTGSPIVSSVLGANTWAIETLGNYAGQSLLQLKAANIPYWLRSGRLFTRANGSTDIVLSYKYVGPAPQPAEHTPGSTDIEYRIRVIDVPGFSEATPLVVRGGADNFTASPLTPIGSGGGGGGSPPGTPQPPEIPPLDPPVNPPNPPGRYSCTCPDFTCREAADPSSKYDSRWQSRGWEESSAGTDDYCYHIMAVAQREGDNIL